MGVRQLNSGEVAEALAGAASIKDACIALGTGIAALELRCRDEGLIGLYEACAARGTTRRGKARAVPKMPRWAIILSQPGYQSVPIFHPYATTEAEALAVANEYIPKSVPRKQLTAVQEVSR